MATTSEVKAGLDEVADRIRKQRAALQRAKQLINQAQSALSNIPSDYSDLITTIDNYAGDDRFELLAKDEKTRLASEFGALNTKAQNAQTALSGIDFTP